MKDEAEKLLMMFINDAYKNASGKPSQKTGFEMMRYVANMPDLQQLIGDGNSKKIISYRATNKVN